MHKQKNQPCIIITKLKSFLLTFYKNKVSFFAMHKQKNQPCIIITKLKSFLLTFLQKSKLLGAEGDYRVFSCGYSGGDKTCN